MPSGLELIKRAMRIAGVTGQSETASSSEADDGLIALNDMLNSWETDRTYVFSILNENFPLDSNQTTYTIGPGGDFNTARPNKIDYAFVRFQSSDFPLKIINNQDYDDLTSKGVQTGLPLYLYYNPAFPLGQIKLWGAPASDYTLFIDSWQQLTEFADLTTVYTFPPGYNRAIVYGLAMELAPEYGMSLSPEAVQIGMEAKANIRNLNLPAPVMKTEVGLLTGLYGYNSRLGIY